MSIDHPTFAAILTANSLTLSVPRARLLRLQFSCPSHDHLHREMNGVELQVQTKQMRCFLAFSTYYLLHFTRFLTSQMIDRIK